MPSQEYEKVAEEATFIRTWAQIISEARVNKSMKEALQIRESTFTKFPKNCNKGVFATKNIPKDTKLADYFEENAVMINDALMNLGPILEARTSQEMYDALTTTRETYYDAEKAAKYLNVGLSPMWGDNVALRDIAQDEELFRVYGFPSWLVEIATRGILTLATLPGFVFWVIDTGMWSCGPTVPTYARFYMNLQTNSLQKLYALYGLSEFDSAKSFDAWAPLCDLDMTTHIKYEQTLEEYLFVYV